MAHGTDHFGGDLDHCQDPGIVNGFFIIVLIFSIYFSYL